MKRSFLAPTIIAIVASLTPIDAVALPSCSELAALLEADPTILAASSNITPAAGTTPAYCQVNVTKSQAINIRVGLPLSELDGGIGGVQGAWNGRVENLGGGGYGGTIRPVTKPVTSGYVGSSTDTGHSATWCNAINPVTGQPNSQPNCGLAGGGFVLDPNHELLKFQVTDFIEESLVDQVKVALLLTKAYYGQAASRNYWNGCSMGGRQGMEMAQRHADLFDGILAGSPAMNLNRFITADLWPAVVIRDVIGPDGLSVAKYNAANAAAVDACDAIDGVNDGIINEPRRCSFDASTLQCTGSADDAPTCLTPQEAEAINMIWDGARNQRGERLWGGIARGTGPAVGGISTLVPGTPNATNVQDGNQTYVANWLYQDPDYDSLVNVTVDNFAESFQLADRKFADSPTTDDFVVSAATDSLNLDELRERRGKLLLYHGAADPLIVPFGSWNYVSNIFDRYSVKKTQEFFRSFFFPGNGHCGGGVNHGTPLINRVDLFDALVNWVENGVEPDYIVAYNNQDPKAATVSRKICKYPDEAVYDGGDPNDESNFHCEVHKREPADLKADNVVAERYFEAERSGDRHRHRHDDRD